jgi:hypothetical protein
MSTLPETKSAEMLTFSHYLRTGERLTGEAAQAFVETKARADERVRLLKSAESALFSHYLRTGERLHGEAAEHFLELKFNQRHYRENGQFARHGEGAVYGGDAHADPSATISKPRINASARHTPSGTALPAATQTLQPSANKAEEGRAIFHSRGQAAFETWARQPGGETTYQTYAPATVKLFRERSARFRAAEEQILQRSIKGWIQKPVEHTLLVYRNTSPENRNEFQFRILKGDPKTGVMGPFRDQATGKVLQFGRLPQMAGYDLFLAEHVHPTPRSRGVGPKSHNGPSNADLYHADSNPGTYFIVRHVDVNGTFEGFATSFTYFGSRR